MTILNVHPQRNCVDAAALGSNYPDTMVYTQGNYDDDLAAIAGTKHGVSSFCDDENASFANDLVINLALGKLNTVSPKETLHRNVLLQNVLNERVQEREVGIQCYGKIRMREVRGMVERERRMSGLSAPPRTWDDDEDTQDIDMDSVIACQSAESSWGFPNTSHDGDSLCHDDDCDYRPAACEFEEEMCPEGDSEDSTTDEDDMDLLSVDGVQAAPVCSDIVVAQPERSPVRIKLVLKANTSHSCSSNSTPCSNSSDNGQMLNRPRLKRKRNVGADLTNSNAKTDRDFSVCGKRARYNTTSTPQDWSSMRGLSPTPTVY